MAKAKPVVNSLLVSVPVLVAALTMRPSAVLAGGATLPQSLAPTQMREDTGAAAMPKLAVDKLWFSANSDVLAATNEQLLDAIAAELVAHPEYERVAIAGHASPKTDSGNERVRWNLALRRARQTVDALVARGVDAERFVILSYGTERAEARGRDELERRVQVKLLAVRAPEVVIGNPVAAHTFIVPKVKDSPALARHRELVSALGIAPADITPAVAAEAVPVALGMRLPHAAPIPSPSLGRGAHLGTGLTLGPATAVPPGQGVAPGSAPVQLRAIHQAGDFTCRVDSSYERTLATSLQ